MKFILETITSSGRVGAITEIARLPGGILETPVALLYTKGGSVPHLTHEVLQFVTKEQHGIQVPLSSTAHFSEALSQYKKGLAEFVGLKECFTYCTIQDPAVTTPQGYNEKDAISIWSRSGKISLDPQRYMDTMEAFRPDMYHSLCDGDTNILSSTKRALKAVNKSTSLFEKCFERHTKSEVLKNSGFLAVVEGGYDIHAREKSAKALATKPVHGFVVDGLHTNGADVESLEYEQVKPVLEETLKHLPDDKLRVVHGCWNPDTILNMVELGIDVFDTSYPYILAERGSALIFVYNNLDTMNNKISKDKSEITVPQDSSGQHTKEQDAVHHKYELSLKDSRYAEDLTPISDTCNCFTCKSYTKAYIHYLYDTKELLGSVLLMIHNLHHFLEFFKSIRAAVRHNSLPALRKSINN